MGTLCKSRKHYETIAKLHEQVAAPEPKEVKLVAFIDSQGQLRWIREEQFPNCDLVRVPDEDKEILL